jgi:hypothetical protein
MAEIRDLPPELADKLRFICENVHRFPKSPSFPFFPDDWLGSTRILAGGVAAELAGVGAYINLLAVAWGVCDLCIPDDPERLAIMSRAGSLWPQLSDFVLQFFRKHTIHNGLVNQKQIEIRHFQLLQAIKGQAGGQARCQAATQAESKAANQAPSPSPSPSPNLIPVTKKEDKVASIDGLELAKHLRDRIVVNCKSAKVSRQSGAALDETIRKWGVEIDRIMRCDKRTKGEMMAVIDFAHDDNVPRGPSKFCWASQVQGPLNLRNDGLWAQMDAAKKTDSRWDYGSRR